MAKKLPRQFRVAIVKMYIFDTDHLSILQRQGNSAQPLIHRLQLNTQPIVATVINYEEQTRGWMKYFAQAKNLEQ